jgi:hypothetical protein
MNQRKEWKEQMKTRALRRSTNPAGLVRVPAGTIERRMFSMRGHTVMLDSDLAKLYGVTTGAFNQAVKRNSDRFPADFMFQLTQEEARSLRSQFVILDATGKDAVKQRGRHSKYAPHSFTEHGIAMLSSVLRSKRAVQMNIQIIRAFVRLREMLINHKDLALRVEKLETARSKHSTMIGVLASEILEMKKLRSLKRHYGFRIASDDSSSRTGSSAAGPALSRSK